MEDTQIITLFWNREESAIDAVDKKYHRLCYGIAWNLLSNREDSEECVNDTWYAAWRSIPPQRPSKLPAFLGKITRGIAIDLLRMKYAVKRMDKHIVDVTEEVKELNAAVVHSMEDHFNRQDLVRVMNEFLHTLSEADADIFIQRYWVVAPVKKIAARHGLSETAVKQRLLRMRKKLRIKLEEEGHL